MSLVDKNRRLRVLYAQLPKIKCQGLCHESCGPVGMSMGVHEQRCMTRALGEPIGYDPVTLTCSALDAEHRCRGYEARPMLCRLFGVAEGLQCPHGCRPERLLTDDEARAFLKKSDNI